jgi:tRNA-specific 2-thiouridylase
MKFKKLLERAELLGCSRIVTGHYARAEERDGRYVLRRGADETKDQSYVLYFLNQELLRRVSFPLGELTKPEVRAIAEKNGFLNAGKPDSQDICFVPDGDYARVIEERLGRPAEKGDFVDRDGRVLGTHNGIIRYTLGQHRGLGLSLPEAMYVCAIDAEHNRVVLGRQEELYSREVRVRDFSWVSGERPDGTVRCTAKLRYAHRPQPAAAEAEGDRVLLTFDEPQRAATPGQAAVLYCGDGAGRRHNRVIKHRERR